MNYKMYGSFSSLNDKMGLSRTDSSGSAGQRTIITISSINFDLKSPSEGFV